MLSISVIVIDMHYDFAYFTKVKLEVKGDFNLFKTKESLNFLFQYGSKYKSLDQNGKSNIRNQFNIGAHERLSSFL